MDIRGLLRDAEATVADPWRRIEARLEPSWPELVGELAEYASHLIVTRGLARNSVGGYLVALEVFGHWAHHRGIGLRDLTPQQVEAWMRDMFLEGKAVATRSKYLTALRGFLRWRIRMQRAGSNAAAEVEGPRKAKRLPKPYTRAQVRALFEACRGSEPIRRRDFALLMLLLATGARAAEMATLRLDQFEIRERTGEVRFTGKGSKERGVTFEKPVVDALMAWFTVRDTLPLHQPELAWCGLEGKHAFRPLPVDALSDVVARIGRRAGIKAQVGLHRFRYTFATEMYDIGTDLHVIQRLLGHEKIETTILYIAMSSRAQRTRMPAKHLRTLSGTQEDLPRYVQMKIGEHGHGRQG